MKNTIIESTPPVSLRHYLSVRKANNKFKNVTFTLRGRDAISLAIRHFGIKKTDTILLPGYLCGIIVNPFTGNFRKEYYDIEKDFSINPEVIESVLNSRKIKVLYVIHYFGFLHRNINQLSQICKKYSVFLWEDHAHSALSNFNYDFADAIIFSFRKLLPIPDGGGLWVANSSPLPLRGALASNITSMLILAQRSKLGMSKRFGRIKRPIYYHSTASVYKGIKEIIPHPISYLSKRLIRQIDTKSLFDIRRDIFRKWQEFFNESRFQPVFSLLPDDICPQSFPVWIQNYEDVLREFWSSNVRLRSRWTLKEQMKEKCPVAYDISNSIISLPIYPNLSESDMERIMLLLKRYGKPLPKSKSAVTK